jgi:hypothetical protein
MHDDEVRRLERSGNAAMTAGLAALVLGGLGFGVVWGIPGTVCVGCMIGVLGAIVGVLSASAKSLSRASLAGAAVFGLPAAFVIVLLDISSYDAKYPFDQLLYLTAQQVWFLVAFSSLGSIIAHVGRSVGGRSAGAGGWSSARQFTLKQLMALFIPVALYLGYITSHWPRVR